MMATRYAVTLYASASGFWLAVLLMWAGAAMHDRRLLIVGSTVAIGSWVTGVAMWVFGRTNCMVNAYRAGYRAGRNDANARLLEDGLWLSEKAEEDARRTLGNEDDLF